MQQTETLKLNIIEGSDTVDPAPINQNMEALETETQAIRTALTTETAAIRTDFAAADATLRTDFTAADSAIRTDFTAADAGLEAQVSALSADLGSTGQNARVVLGSYTGTGKYGHENLNTLTFDFKPVLVYVRSYTSYGECLFMRPSNVPGGESNDSLICGWGDNSLSWCSSSSANYQFNVNNATYNYIAFGVDE